MPVDLIVGGKEGLVIGADGQIYRPDEMGLSIKSIGRGIAKGAKGVGKGVAKGAKATGKGVAKGAKATGKGVAKGAKATGKVAKKVAKVAVKLNPVVLAALAAHRLVRAILQRLFKNVTNSRASYLARMAGRAKPNAADKAAAKKWTPGYVKSRGGILGKVVGTVMSGEDTIGEPVTSTVLVAMIPIIQQAAAKMLVKLAVDQAASLLAAGRKKLAGGEALGKDEEDECLSVEDLEIVEGGGELPVMFVAQLPPETVADMARTGRLTEMSAPYFPAGMSETVAPDGVLRPAVRAQMKRVATGNSDTSGWQFISFRKLV